MIAVVIDYADGMFVVECGACQTRAYEETVDNARREAADHRLITDYPILFSIAAVTAICQTVAAESGALT